MSFSFLCEVCVCKTKSGLNSVVLSLSFTSPTNLHCHSLSFPYFQSHYIVLFCYFIRLLYNHEMISNIVTIYYICINHLMYVYFVPWSGINFFSFIWMSWPKSILNELMRERENKKKQQLFVALYWNSQHKQLLYYIIDGKYYLLNIMWRVCVGIVTIEAC